MWLVYKDPPRLLYRIASHTRRLLSAATPQPFNLLDYLVTTVGLPPDRASRAARHLAHVSSPAKPDSVLLYLHRAGFPPASIATLVSRHPRLLCAKIAQTLAPKLDALLALGLSSPELVRLVSHNPSALRLRDLTPKIKFWRTIFPSTDDLLRALKGDYLLTCSLRDRIIPNISFLRSCAIPDSQIARLVAHGPGFISRSPATLRAVVHRARDLGDPLRSPAMFFYLLHALGNISSATLDAKIALFKEFGWSEVEIRSAIKKTPYVLKVSESKARAVVAFLMGEAGCTPAYLAFHPVLLLYNLHGRVVPRYRVLERLKRKNLIKKDLALTHAMAVSQEKFIERFIVPYEDKVRKIYARCLSRASASKISS